MKQINPPGKAVLKSAACLNTPADEQLIIERFGRLFIYKIRRASFKILYTFPVLSLQD